MKLLHLYHDLMNLYGDYANVLALQRILEKSGVDVTVDRLSLGDPVVFTDYDFIFVGSGTEKNQKVVLNDLMKHRDQIAAYIASGKPLLMTGNSFEMLGKTNTAADGTVFFGLGLYDFTVAEEHGVRITGDVVCSCAFLDRPLVGFINKSSYLYGIDRPLFEVSFGVGNAPDDKREGIFDNAFYGTHLTGPLLQKNPHFLIKIARDLLKREPETSHLEYERKGYENTLQKLLERAKAQ